MNTRSIANLVTDGFLERAKEKSPQELVSDKFISLTSDLCTRIGFLTTMTHRLWVIVYDCKVKVYIFVLWRDYMFCLYFTENRAYDDCIRGIQINFDYLFCCITVRLSVAFYLLFCNSKSVFTLSKTSQIKKKKLKNVNEKYLNRVFLRIA